MPVAKAQATINRPTWDDVNADPSILFDPDDALSVDSTRSWVDPNGYRLSDRIWRAGSYDRAALDTELQSSLAAGLGPEQTAKNIVGYMTPAGQAMQARSPRAGMGNYAARRLARTETTRAFGDAMKKAGALNPFVKGIKWLLSGSHEDIDICDEHAQRSSDGEEWGPGEYAFDDSPPYPSHPNELCTLATIDVSQDAIDRMTDPRMPRLFFTEFGDRSEAAFDIDAVIAQQKAAQETLSHPFEPATTIADAEDVAMSGLGINSATYTPPPYIQLPGDDPEDAADIRSENEKITLAAANAINKAVYEVLQRGMSPPPHNVRVSLDSAMPDAIAYHDSKDDSITANTYQPAWSEDDQDLITKEHEEGWFVAENPADLIMHELGHHFHVGYGNDPQIQGLARHFPTAAEDATMASVSHYAQSSPYEYVAEVFLKLMKGESLTPEQAELYKRWHGPDVPPPKES